MELSDYEQGEAGETVLGEVSTSRGENSLIVIQSNTITEGVSDFAVIFTIFEAGVKGAQVTTSEQINNELHW